MSTLKSGDLKQAYVLMLRSLYDCTGLPESSRKVVACYTMATHALPDPQTKNFPIAAIRGKLGSGKSSIIKIIENYAHRPKRITMATSTLPLVRDHLASCREGTAILEEADSCLHDRECAVEVLLNARYSRATETGGLKVQMSEKNTSHVSKEIKLFGASVIHQRGEFKDAVLDGKSVRIVCRPNFDRDYLKFDPTDSWNVEGRKLVEGKTLTLPKVVKPSKVSDRVFDTYMPVLAIASLLDDAILNDYLLETMNQETKRLQRSQGEEPEATVLNALIEKVLENVYLTEAGHLCGNPNFSRIAVSDLCSLIRQRQDQYEKRITSYQAANYCRDAGFRVEAHSGRQHVFPTIESLFRACDYCCLTEDKTVKALRSKVEGSCIHGEKKKEKEEGQHIHAAADFSRDLSNLKDLDEAKKPN